MLKTTTLHVVHDKLGPMLTQFEKAYQRLNPKQQQAVDTIDGPVMVIAGPGTGKTQVLTLRIANILKNQDINPQNILALTFTESATTTMRQRLIDLIGTAGYNVRIQTFHAFCQGVISSYPEYFPFRTDSTPASEIQTHAIMEKLLDDPKLIALRTPGSKYHYVKKILSAINTLKSEGITPPKFKELVAGEEGMFEQERESLTKTIRVKKESALAKQKELSLLYTGYQKELRETGLIDFTDMIMHTVEALRKSEILRTLLQENLQYILVDEYQDTNGAQNTVVDLLASYWGENANVFVVGDPHQTIFRFQGASFENTIGFLTRYPTAQVISLQKGYRCPDDIYRSSHALISHNISSQALLSALAEQNSAIKSLVEAISQPLETKKNIAKTLFLATLPTETDEQAWIAEDIKSLMTAGKDSSVIAILVKTNDQATAISTTLSQHEIDHRVDRTTNALETVVGRQLVALFRTLASLPTNTESEFLYPTLSSPWMKLPPVALMSLTRAFAKQKSESSFASFILSGWTMIKRSAIAKPTKEEYEAVEASVTKLMELSQISHTIATPNWIADIYKELGILDWIQTQEKVEENLSILSAFHSFATASYETDHTFSLNHLVGQIETMERQGLSLPITPIASDSAGVTVATIHKAKGREWDHVYIPNFSDGIWGGGKGMTGILLPDGIIATQMEDDATEDERRLLYVALTRAKEHAILSYHSQQTGGGKVTVSLPSQFLSELPSELISTIDTSTHDTLQSNLTSLQPVLPKPFGVHEREWIQSIVDSMSLSVSALNVYLRDPQAFFVQQILKAPQPAESHLAFGNAVHAALEAHYKVYRSRDNTHPEDNFALGIFEDRLKREILSPNDFESRKVQGENVLKAYLEQKRQEFPQVLATEEGFGWKRGPILLDDIKLSGKVDRMDILDASSQLLHIIDYKTGKQKSINTIEGKVGVAEMSERERSLPEPIRGAMKRQLLFYKLLLARDPLYRSWSIGKATFDFVQQDADKFVERSFNLENDDVKLLEKLIKEVMVEIRELKFLEAL